MILRQSWLAKIQSLLLTRSLLWIGGPVGVGKSQLLRQLPQAKYFDCEQSSDLNHLQHEHANLSHSLVILDELRFVAQPDRILKTLLRPDLKNKVICSSSLKWTYITSLKELTRYNGEQVMMLGMTLAELKDQSQAWVDHYLSDTGVPGFLLSDLQLQGMVESFEKLYWKSVIERSFMGCDRQQFHQVFQLLGKKSGEAFDEAAWATELKLNRKDLLEQISFLQAGYCVLEIPAFEPHLRKTAEPWPVFYFFDRAFSRYYQQLSKQDPAHQERLWTHLVFLELVAHVSLSSIYHGQDRIHAGVPFIVSDSQGIHAIFPKSQNIEVDLTSLLEFRRHEPYGKNILVQKGGSGSQILRKDNLVLEQVGLDDLQRVFSTLVRPRKSV